jgi:hypothetical protein
MSLTTWSPAIAVLGGIAVGALTLGGQRVLPGAYNQLANSGAVWSVAAFAAARFLPVRRPRAAVIGAFALVGAVVGYYASTTLVLHDDVDAATMRAPLTWLAVAVIAGPLLGIAGMLARVDDRAWIRAVALGLPGAVFVGEAVYQAIVNHHDAVAGLLVVIGVVLTPLFARSGSDRLRATIAFVPVSVVGVGAVGAAYAAVNAVLS